MRSHALTRSLRALRDTARVVGAAAAACRIQVNSHGDHMGTVVRSPSFVQLGCKCVPVEDRWRGTLFATTRVSDAYRNSVSPRGGEKVVEEPAPYLIRGRMRGERDA